jgi:predicted O-methyltransferase YrrM
VTWSAAPIHSDAYDLAFHDLAVGAVRVDTLPVVLSAVRRGGVALLDDAHHYGGQMFKSGRAAGMGLYSLRSRTLDGYGRYAILAVA